MDGFVEKVIKSEITQKTEHSKQILLNESEILKKTSRRIMSRSVVEGTRWFRVLSCLESRFSARSVKLRCDGSFRIP
jgi:hypothetical protein